MNVSNTFEDVTGGNSTSAILVYRTYAKVLAVVVIDNSTCLTTIKMSWGNDELRHIERKETVTIKTARIALGQHEGLADRSIGIDMAEIGTRKKAVVAT